MTETQARQSWMSLLAKAPAARLDALWQAEGHAPEFDWLRRPEIGTVMVQARTGARGDAFNMGEMTVTRCALRLEGGETGHAYVQGRDKAKAEQAALIDALMQTALADTVDRVILTPLRDEMRAEATDRAAKAASTKVDFFTMVRGED